MIRLFLFVCSILVITICTAQYNWKLEKQNNGISVYLSDVPGSKFKATKVECTLAGNYSKLIGLLNNVSHFPNWVYNCNSSKLLRRYTENDFIYYSVTHLPWPLSNRDIAIHMRINTDSLPKLLTISGTAEPDLYPLNPDYVRVRHYNAIWKVTMPTAQTIRVTYLLEMDPEGSIPGWVANIFTEKGPYGTFCNIADELKK